MSHDQVPEDKPSGPLLGLGLIEGLGLAPERDQPTNADDAAAGNENAIRHIAYAEGYAAGKVAEREACREVVEECIRTQAHIASNAREALSEASARIYKRGRA